MTSWKEFEQQAPEFAEFGKARFQSGVAYLGTLRPDGSPCVHPVTPIIGEQLFGRGFGRRLMFRRITISCLYLRLSLHS